MLRRKLGFLSAIIGCEICRPSDGAVTRAGDAMR
jgi:hypothetical protein